MKELLKELLKGCKNLKQVINILNNNNINYAITNNIIADEVQIKDHGVTHRIYFFKKELIIKSMIKHTIKADAETLLKIQYVQNNCKY